MNTEQTSKNIFMYIKNSKNPKQCNKIQDRKVG